MSSTDSSTVARDQLRVYRASHAFVISVYACVYVLSAAFSQADSTGATFIGRIASVVALCTVVFAVCASYGTIDVAFPAACQMWSLTSGVLSFAFLLRLLMPGWITALVACGAAGATCSWSVCWAQLPRATYARIIRDHVLFAVFAIAASCAGILLGRYSHDHHIITDACSCALASFVAIESWHGAFTLRHLFAVCGQVTGVSHNPEADAVAFSVVHHAIPTDVHVNALVSEAATSQQAQDDEFLLDVGVTDDATIGLVAARSCFFISAHRSTCGAAIALASVWFGSVSSVDIPIIAGCGLFAAVVVTYGMIYVSPSRVYALTVLTRDCMLSHIASIALCAAITPRAAHAVRVVATVLTGTSLVFILFSQLMFWVLSCARIQANPAPLIARTTMNAIAGICCVCVISAVFDFVGIPTPPWIAGVVALSATAFDASKVDNALVDVINAGIGTG